MRRFDRKMRIASVVALGLSLSACEYLENLMDTKKPLPGERKPVFADGVPGVPQGVPPELKPVVSEVMRTGLRWLKMGILEGKEIILRLDLDPKSGAFVSEWSLEGKSGSALAKSFAGMKPTKNDFSHIIGTDSAAHAVVQAGRFLPNVPYKSVRVKETSELRIGGVVEARFHLRSRPSNLAKSSSEAMDLEVPAFSCW
jgi:hypothetical protein